MNKTQRTPKHPRNLDPGLLLASARGIGTDTERLLAYMTPVDRWTLFNRIVKASHCLVDIELARVP